jgi:hypothetical protein
MSRGAKIGENRFREYVDIFTSAREDQLLSIVIDIQREKLTFKTLTSMSHYVAKRFNEHCHSESKKITNTTILRNSRYRAILLRLYLDDTKSINENTTSAEILELRLENERLKKSLMKADEEIKKIERSLEEKTRNFREFDDGCDIVALDACYKIILTILEGSNGMYVISEDGIVDKSNIYNNVLVQRKLLDLSGIARYQHNEY